MQPIAGTTWPLLAAIAAEAVVTLKFSAFYLTTRMMRMMMRMTVMVDAGSDGDDDDDDDDIYLTTGTLHPTSRYC